MVALQEIGQVDSTEGVAAGEEVYVSLVSVVYKSMHAIVQARHLKVVGERQQKLLA